LATRKIQLTKPKFDAEAFIRQFRENCEKGARALSPTAQNSPKTGYRGYSIDIAQESGVTKSASYNPYFPNEINSVTPVTPKQAKNSKAEEGEAPYGHTIAALRKRCPDYVEVGRWQQAVKDGRRFLAQWGDQAAALGWTAKDLFGLFPVPEKPHPTFNRLSRYDETGLCWLLEGRTVVAPSSDTAVIRTATGPTLKYRKDNKPALGPVGDSLDDFVA
jgi:hypothetical protein